MTTSTLPHWDMSVIYPGLDSPEFTQGFQAVVESIKQLVALFDQYGIAHHPAAPLDDATVRTFDTVTERYNAVLEATYTLRAYIYSFVATDSRDTQAQAALSELQQQTVPLSLLGTRWTAWIGSLDIDTLIQRSALAQAHTYALQKARTQAAHLMTPAEEALAIELNLTGGSAWARLYNTFTSQLMVPIELDGTRQELPMSAIRNLAFDPRREVRKQAYEAELATWQRAAVPIAAALNGIKGETNTLAKWRGWDSPLDVALFNNHIDRQTLDAMMEAAHESFPDFRRYLRAKAHALGLRRLPWYDLFAPVGKSSRVWSFEEASAFVGEQFGRFSVRLRRLADRAFDEQWIDAEPRHGKGGGAFCMSLRDDESRVLLNFEPSFSSVSTLAHELGHAYHNLNLAQRTMIQRSTPMTLAETASIFCETIVVQAALDKADEQEQLMILEGSLSDACQVVVDITSRFQFEQQVFDRRRQRDLSIDEFCQLMLDAQRQTYGDGLDTNVLHPYMWAVKGHYYGSTFYNFPYMFGLLFGLGLYARYRHQPEQFKAGYDDLLSSTGLDGAAELAAHFSIDTRSRDFWRSSFDVIRADIARFEKLAEANRSGS